MLIELTHVIEGYDFWVETKQIVAMERKKKIKTTLVTLDDTPESTVLVLECGKIMQCLETPEQIINIIKGV